LVTFIAWQLARHLKRAGAQLNVERVLEYALVHDAAELFGSDIAVPYARLNPKAKQAAKEFEAENQRFLERFFGPDGEYFGKLNREIVQHEGSSDEYIVAKVADWLELIHYLVFVDKGSKRNVSLVRDRMDETVEQMKDEKGKKELQAFLTTWAEEVTTIETPDKLLNLDE
jgi:5'-deoxynucleotidase YfbR-like HD superfamily hydrolase